MAHWMNESDVEQARRRWAAHPVLGPATLTLCNLVEAVNANSDGWPYWRPPALAAAKLMDLIERDGTAQYFRGPRDDATADELAKAYVPLKSFRTRRGLQFKIVTPAEYEYQPSFGEV